MEEPRNARPLLLVFIAWCFCGSCYGIVLFFHRPNGSFQARFTFQEALPHIAALAMAVPGCGLSILQSVLSLRAISSRNEKTLRNSSIRLAVHTIVFTATSTVLIVRPFAGYQPVRIASAIHICLQVPFAVIAIRTILQYRRYILSLEPHTGAVRELKAVKV